jgi:hypothetical protein
MSARALLLSVGVGCLVVLGTSRPARAQYNPAVRAPGTLPPIFSPYLNLNRPGESPGINYYGLVRPEIYARNSITNLQQQVNQVQAETFVLGTVQEARVLPPTGYTVRFMDYQRYFPGGIRTGALGQAPAQLQRPTAPQAAAPGVPAPRGGR